MERSTLRPGARSSREAAASALDASTAAFMARRLGARLLPARLVRAKDGYRSRRAVQAARRLLPARNRFRYLTAPAQRVMSDCGSAGARCPRRLPRAPERFRSPQEGMSLPSAAESVGVGTAVASAVPLIVGPCVGSAVASAVPLIVGPCVGFAMALEANPAATASVTAIARAVQTATVREASPPWRRVGMLRRGGPADRPRVVIVGAPSNCPYPISAPFS